MHAFFSTTTVRDSYLRLYSSHLARLYVVIAGNALKRDVAVDVAPVAPAVPSGLCSVPVVPEVVYGILVRGGLCRPHEADVVPAARFDGGEDDVADYDPLFQERAEQECIAASEQRVERTFA